MNKKNGHDVVDIDADGKFECLKLETEGVRIDIIHPLERNNKGERSMSTVKDGIRCQV